MIREHLGFTPDEIAPKVGARTGVEIAAYENHREGLLVSVLWGYVKLAGCSLEDLIDDDREVTFR